jgi:hypothetical protein
MDGHLMFPIYGTLIIVIINRISLISHMKKNNSLMNDYVSPSHGSVYNNIEA